MLSVLRQRSFALLWFGQLISVAGDRLLFVALPFYIYQLTGSTLATGGMFVAQLIPSLLLGSVAGVFVDRWDRRRVMIVSDVVRGLLMLLLLVVSSADLLWLIYAVAFAQSAIGQFFGPARNAIIPRLVAGEDLMRANSLNAMSDSFTRLGGSSLGGILFALFGLPSVVLVDALTFFVSALLIVWIVVPPLEAAAGLEPAQPAAPEPVSPTAANAPDQPDENESPSLFPARPALSSLLFAFARFGETSFGELAEVAEVARGRFSLPALTSFARGSSSRLRAGFATVWSEWLAGLRVVRADRMLTSLFLIMSIFSMADAIFSTLLVPFAKDIMHVGTAELGFVLASQGVGGLLGSVIVARLGARVSPQRWIALACFGDGLLLLAIFNLPVLWVALALIFLAGILMVGLMVSVNTLLQTASTDAYRGRVFGAWQAIGGLMLLIGALLAGSLAELLGVLPILDAGALLWVFAGLLAAAFVPGVMLRAARTHAEPAHSVPAYDQNV